MKNEIRRSAMPEEAELEEKLVQLSQLETDLADRELELATLNRQLEAVESRYTRIAGVKFAELDEINAKIAEARARSAPAETSLQEKYARAAASAKESAKAWSKIGQGTTSERFEPTEELKSLYRELARAIHPDLATDEIDRERRNELMAEANRAYEVGDHEKLEEILSEWRASPEAILGEDITARLVRTIRIIARIENRLSQIESQLEAMKASDVYQLNSRVDLAAKQSRDLIREIAQQVDEEIQLARETLASLSNAG